MGHMRLAELRNAGTSKPRSLIAGSESHVLATVVLEGSYERILEFFCNQRCCNPMRK